MKKLMIILSILSSLSFSFAKEAHFKLKKPSVYNYPYLIDYYGLKKAKKIIKQRYYQLTYISASEFEILKKTYYHGKSIDLPLTLCAILWNESQFGKHKINFADPSCGYFHKSLPVYCDELGIKATMYNMSRVCEKLQNYEFSVNVALDDLKRLKNRYELKGYKGNTLWKKIVQGYNGSGYRTKVYLDFIRLNIFYLKQIKSSLKDY